MHGQHREALKRHSGVPSEIRQVMPYRQQHRIDVLVGHGALTNARREVNSSAE